METLKRYVKSSESIIVFVILELIALMCFGLGGSNIIFFIVGIIANIATIPFMIVNSNKEELKHFAIYALPLVLVALFVCFGKMYSVPAYFVNNLCSFLAIISFLMIGYSVRRIKGFKIENALLIMGAALALVTLISMIATWFNYGLMYATKYESTPIYYYNGELFNVTEESSWLLGFALKELSLPYTGLFGFLSTLFLIGCFFVNPKKDIKKFIVYLVVGLIGLVALATVPNIYALKLLLPSAIMALVYRFLPKFKHNQKVVDILFFSVVALVCIGLSLAILNNYVPSFAAIVKSNRYTNKALNGLYMDEVNEVLGRVFKSPDFFGIYPSLTNGNTIRVKTMMFEAEIMKEGGFLALLFFMIFMVVTYLSMRAYNKNSKDSPLSKIMLISLVFGFFIYSSLNYDALPVVHEDGTYYAFFRSLPTLVMVMICGYTFYPFLKKDVSLYIDSEDFARGVIVEEKKVEKKKVDKDYNFDEEDNLDE